MTAKNRPARFRVGRVSYYQHHGSWYLYFSDRNGPQRQRIGRSQAAAEQAAAIKNAELLTGDTALTLPSPQVLLPGAAEMDRRSFAASAMALLGGLVELGHGLRGEQVL
mgnify:FL=1